ncbi:hypothetical protein Vadar_011856 [Vaccinium darrowii]|uniref:Uncharacterized protein n=1 Tax=Vaccinium darrowii TaxID=229202 RepID=A0ACB7Y621_9ERIC|nr:hypothetical protein Vadar_011856 [Vaccinium darrowii]
MGCMASKLENEDAVTRCKDRRRHMKEAIYAHRHLVTAHSSYVCSLPVIGSALSAFAGDAVKEYFDKAASAGEKVSEMLETGRAQLTGTKSLCWTLEQLLAREEKLYQEVKAREGLNIEHEKKSAALQSQKYRGGGEEKLGKTKASIERLQSRIVVSSQAVSAASTFVIRQRDTDLVPQLVALCRGSMNMWKSLNGFPEVLNRSTSGESTSNLHPESIDHLQSALSNWHGSFCRRTKFEREFIHSLHAWFELPLLLNAELPHPTPVSSDKVGLFDKWKIFHDSHLAKAASGAIKNFNCVVQGISRTQTEQLKKSKKIEKKSKEIEEKSKEIEKKSLAPSSIKKQHYHLESRAGNDSRPDDCGHAQDRLSKEKSKLAVCQREVKKEMLRHTKEKEETRTTALNDILKGLETVLQTLSNNFYGSIVEALETVCKQCNNAEGVPEESGRDVEAQEGGGAGEGGGESENNNAEGVPEESGIGDVEAHEGGGDESDNNYAEGSQRRVEEEMLRHTKEEEEEEEEETRARLTTMMASFQRIVEEEMLRHPEPVAAAAAVIPSFSVMNECMAF